MTYTLDDAVAAVRARNPWLSRPVELEPMEGLVDGVNKNFHIKSIPASGTVSVYDDDGTQLTVASSSLTSGLVTLQVAPSTPVYASYTHVTVSDSALTGICQEGFSLMQSILPRSWYLYDDGNDVHVSSSASSAVDPVIGSSTFSAMPVQVRFFVNCCVLEFFTSQWAQAAFNSVMLREERVGGLQIDTTKVADAFSKLVDNAQRAVEQSASAAADEAGLTSQLVEGELVAATRSDWTYNTHWWKDSLQDLGRIP